MIGFTGGVSVGMAAGVGTPAGQAGGSGVGVAAGIGLTVFIVYEKLCGLVIAKLETTQRKIAQVLPVQL